MPSLKTDIMAIIDMHARKAQASQYDRSVAIAAIAAARDAVQTVAADLAPTDYSSEVWQKLNTLMQTYHDPDGEYTSGKGVIGDLAFDIYNFFKRSKLI